MSHRAFAIVIATLSLVALAASAPAGPGDAEPIGPLPHVIFHPPVSVNATDTQCEIWVHSFNFPCGIDGYVWASDKGWPSYLSYEIQDMGDGAWDQIYVVDLTDLDLWPNDTIVWLTDVYDYCDIYMYTAWATTSVN